MTTARPHVVIACNATVRENYVTVADLARLEGFASWEWCELGVDSGNWGPPPEDPAAVRRLQETLAGAASLVVCHGAPRVTAEVLGAAPQLRIVGELEGDRFAGRIDVEAANARGVRVVDTTNGSSYPVSEWALAMVLIALRNAGEQFRHLIGHEVYQRPTSDLGYIRGELTGKKVGLIGCGIIGRRFLQLLAPFHCDVRVYDPYIPREVADIFGFLQTNLDFVMSDSDVIVCLAPITPRTRRMIGKRELDLIQPGAALVNVSRGAIIDPDALIERLARRDITGAFDVFDPEPIPADSPIRDLPNVFLTPHIAGVVAAGGPRFFSLMVDELDRFFHGHETRYDLGERALANRRGLPG